MKVQLNEPPVSPIANLFCDPPNSFKIVIFDSDFSDWAVSIVHVNDTLYMTSRTAYKFFFKSMSFQDAVDSSFAVLMSEVEKAIEKAAKPK